MYVADAKDSAQNIAGGTRYLRVLANEFNGDILMAVAAYVSGPEAVRTAKGIPPSAATRTYVKEVMAYYHELRSEHRAP
jgi:soluble lytic murein transglycosylase-like protein